MLTLRQLEAFKAVIDAGSVVKAGEMMGLSQPAVSRLLADLEANVGYRLFDRRGRRLAPLAEARELYIEVERSYVGLSRIEEAAERIGRRKSTRLRIAAIPSMTTGPLTIVVAQFLEEHPELFVTLETRTRPQIVDGIVDGLHDIGMASMPIDRPDVGVLPVPGIEIECACLVPVAHPFSRLEAITLEDLDGEPCIMAADRTPIVSKLRQMLAEAGSRPDIRAEVTTAEAGADLAKKGIGICVGWGFKRDIPPGNEVRFVPLHPRMPSELAVLYPANRPPEGILEEFVTAFVAAAQFWYS